MNSGCFGWKLEKPVCVTKHDILGCSQHEFSCGSVLVLSVCVCCVFYAKTSFCSAFVPSADMHYY